MTAVFLDDFAAPSRPIEPIAATPPPPPPAPDPAEPSIVDIARVHDRIADLSFTYHEARDAVIGEMRQLLTDISDLLLPALERETFGAVLRGALEAEIDRRSQPPVLIEVSAEDEGRAAAALPVDPAFPVRIRASAALSPGEATIRFETGEVAVLSETAVQAVRERIAEALEDGFAAPGREARHG